MLKPPLPIDETARLKSLHSLRILDTRAEERFDRITRMAQRMFGVRTCLVSLIDSDRQWFKSRQGLDATETPREVSFCGHAILKEEIFIVGDAQTDPRFQDNPLVTEEPNVRFYAGCPIRGPGGKRVGVLCLIDPQPRGLSRDDQETLRDLAALVEDELRVSSQATLDELTGIANRRGFLTVANHLLALCRRTATPADLVFLDLDGFKVVNDQFGHAAGDAALKEFSSLLIKCFRSADVVARLGGDEFVALMAGTTDYADAALGRLRNLADRGDGAGLGRSLRWSVGRVSFDPRRHSGIEDLLRDADESMYEDKQRKAGAAG